MLTGHKLVNLANQRREAPEIITSWPFKKTAAQPEKKTETNKNQTKTKQQKTKLKTKTNSKIKELQKKNFWKKKEVMLKNKNRLNLFLKGLRKRVK